MTAPSGLDGSGKSVAWATALAVLAVLAVATLSARGVALATSPVIDEYPYLCGGYDIYCRGSFAGTVNGGVAPIPILVGYLPLWFELPAGAGPFAPDSPATVGWIIRCRLFQVWVVLPALLVAAAALAWKVRGPGAAVFTAAMLGASPVVQAHASLATTDACFVVCGLGCLTALAAAVGRPGWWSLARLGGAFGLAVGAKYSGVLLWPVIVAVVGGYAARRHPGRVVGRLGRGLAVGVGVGAAVAVVGGAVCWAAHGFSVVPVKEVDAAGTPPGSPWRKVFGTGPRADRILDYCHHHIVLPAPAKGFLKQTVSAQNWGGVYFMGRVHATGSRWFYLVAVLVKSTPSELVVFGLACGGLAWRLGRPGAGPARGRGLVVVLAPAAAVFVVVFSLSAKQLGLRYVLLIYPIGCVLAAWVGQPVRVSPRLWGLGAFALVVGQVVSMASIWPYPISYFNPLCGGITRGDRYLVDTDCDWGSGAFALAGYQAGLPADMRLGVILHSSITVETYGLAVPDAALVQEAAAGLPRLVAVSATTLAYEPALSRLEAVRPVAVVTPGVRVYSLNDPIVRQAVTDHLATTSGKSDG